MTFVFRPWLQGLSLIALAVLLSLGTWQVQRLAWKTSLIRLVEGRVQSVPADFTGLVPRWQQGADVRYTPVRLSGGFPTDRVAHVFGTWEGEPGFFVFQPFRLDDGSDRVVIINRGFVPQAARQDTYELPSADVLTGLVRVPEQASGLAALFQPADRPNDGVFFGRDPEALAQYLLPGDSGELVPLIIDSTLQTELPRGSTTVVAFRNAHLGYALTWFGLAAGLVGVVGAMSIRKRS